MSSASIQQKNITLSVSATNVREVHAAWTFAKADQTKEYKVTWSYYAYAITAPTKTAKSKVTSTWYTGSTDTVSSKKASYTAPDNATKVKVTITPVAKTHKVTVNKRKVDKPYFTGKASTSIEFTLSTVAKKTVIADKIVTITFEQVDGTARTVAAAWDWNKAGTTGYEVNWQYYIGRWFEGTVSTVTNRSSTYDVPEAATKVAVKVRPLSNTWTSPDAEWVEWDTSNFKPSVPSVPTVTIKNNKLTASVNYYEKNATGVAIQFYIVADNTRVINTLPMLVIENYASVQITVAAGSKYKVKAKAVKGTIESDYSEFSADVYAKPKAPGNFTYYAAISETQVKLTWPLDPNVDSYTIEYATKKEYFDVSPANVQSQSELTKGEAIINVETGNTWFFRCCAVAEGISSDWNDVVSVAAGKKPAPPTTWSLTTTAAVGDILKLYWVHNAQDNSSQTEAKLFLTINGVTEEIPVPNNREGDEKDKTSEYDYDTSNLTEGAIITWQVQTRGVHPDFSELSVLRTIKVYAAPTLSFMFSDERKWFWDPFNFTTDTIFTAAAIPAEYPDILERLPIDIIARALPDTQTALRYIITITALESYETADENGLVINVLSGQEVYNKIIYPRSSNAFKNHLVKTITAYEVSLENNMPYELTCTVVMDSGLTASCSFQFTVGWADTDRYPNAEIILDDETYQAYITPYCEDENDNRIGDILLSVYRRNFDGTFTELATDLLGRDNITITDPHPALDYARYRIIAKSVDTGQIWYDDLSSIELGEPAIIIQWGEEWHSFILLDDDSAPEEPPWTGSLLRLPYNIDVSETSAHDVELVEYIGRSHPVSYFGTQKGETTTWNTVIDAEDEETLYGLRRLKAYMGNCYVREPSGIGFWAIIAVSMTQTHREVTIPVTLNITRVEGGA